ncbi:cellulose synthase subunit BcsC-related outer membrane protein [Roseomonas sp. GC11]|uniref:cellulose synthase subunit BcsC-related outer membrane protein n=1 Tax=Roseomonas sp. GC11 TaxID=2950546 RepID=UPI00210CA731|nr:cellulose synthase subunit BcsC-related outer membrane protein [Roseomonas sp. GC11]MCQ4161797.1 cellulose synthase subunit BcsC-related outer membrane protein [Roseomonas sp. GC11]
MPDPRGAQRWAEAVLRRDPRQIEARASAVEAALALGEIARAEALLAEGRALMPNEPRLSLLEARLARATGDGARARAALALAAEQRRGQIGTPYAAAPEGEGARRVALAGRSLTTPPALVGGGYAVPLTTAQPVAVEDPLLGQINRELAQVQDEAAPRLAASADVRSRSGSGGLDRMVTLGASAEASAPLPDLGGRLTLRAQAVNADAGNMGQDAATISRFGSNAASVASNGSITSAQARTLTPQSSATGVSLGLGYTRDSFSADIGSTPLGFRKENVLGGVEVAPSLTSNLRLRVTAERRAVTDTLLSWSGMRDPSTGITWGGVVRNTARAQLEYALGPDTNAYLGGGYSTLEGDGVADNTRIEAYGGISHTLFRRPDSELVTGLDLIYQSYDKNLRYFTLGQGGYFSPQSFMAASIPLDYRARWGDFSYRIGGSIGLASFQEDRSPYFPNDATLQAQQVALAASNSGYSAYYTGQSATAVTGGLRADAEYALTPALRVGAALRYDRSADWSDARGLLYARYRIDP